MKKLSILVAGLMVLSLSACKGGDNKATETAAPAQEQVAENTGIEMIEESDVIEPAAEDVVIEMTADDTVTPVDKPIVVDFNATWCGPCKQFAPVYHALAQQFASKAEFYSCDIDVCQQFAAEQNIESIPTVMIFYPGNKKPVKAVGYMDEVEFLAMLNENL